MKLIVIIPAYNEENSLPVVIREIPREIPGVDEVEVLVINDGSTDATAEVAKTSGADRVISHKKNMGLGVTFKDGLEEALRMGADVIVNTDADGQYNGAEIPRLIEPILKEEADVVIGNRQIDLLDHMPWQKKAGNKMATWVTRRVTGLPILDAQTGFRAFSREAALRMTLVSGSYTYVQETLIEAANKRLAVEQIPIEFRRREGPSRLISNIFKYAKLAGITIIRSYRDYRPFAVFAGIGVVIVGFGILVGARVLIHYLTTGMVVPYLPSAVLTAVLVIVGTQIIVFGFMADMLKTERVIQEEILYRMKKMDIEYNGSDII
ncbi:MAG: Glycosyl transferase family 2 [Methanothrix harundinacea]|uniref:Glycosyl transferase family 2 n=1 Tax=Methanothrix harundinacea TaxID=301375 RepID=A0A101IGM9_9EURY|nr:MAG: Glycosyl transferase family 2 [Methanothrix harundinacea]